MTVISLLLNKFNFKNFDPPEILTKQILFKQYLG